MQGRNTCFLQAVVTQYSHAVPAMLHCCSDTALDYSRQNKRALQNIIVRECQDEAVQKNFRPRTNMFKPILLRQSFL